MVNFPPVEGDLEWAIPRLRDAVSEQLLGGDTARPFTFSVEEDAPERDIPAWTDPDSGACHISEACLEQLQDGDDEAVAAVAHQIIHAIGYGPAFPFLADQLLEEAVVETLAQHYLPQFGAAMGLEIPAVSFLIGVGDDVVVARPVATQVAVGRFARLAAWLEALTGEADAEDLERAAVKLALALKATEGSERFGLLAREAAAVDGETDDVGAAEWLEQYLRGYMAQTTPSEYGLNGLNFASSVAWGDKAEQPARVQLEPPDWYKKLETLDEAALDPLPAPGAIDDALEQLDGEEDLVAVATRSLEARRLLWAARTIDAAKKIALKNQQETTP
jgi:hypothetical protein